MPATRPVGFVFDPAPLRAGREARKKTRTQAAAETPCSESLWSLTELGYKRPAPETLARMAEVVGVSLDDLFVRDDMA
jgi:transcriptional regulator with XRE-family HTH domain